MVMSHQGATASQGHALVRAWPFRENCLQPVKNDYFCPYFVKYDYPLRFQAYPEKRLRSKKNDYFYQKT
jgi:hypothetical protein